MTEKIDAHQHFWRYEPAEFGWIGKSMAMLKRDFLPAELHEEMRAAGIDGSVAVQARQTAAETAWLLALAEKYSFIHGVVGWAHIAGPEFPAVLEQLSSNPKLRGLRHVIQDEPDDQFILRPDFNAGINALLGTGLVYDILIFERHLPQTIQFVDRHPEQVFVLDHAAKPKIEAGELSPWAENIRELSKRQNVYCKISGMVTEADWRSWTPAMLAPYVDTLLEAFGPTRLMAGSDWPVCTVASGYSKWFRTLDSFLLQLSNAERDRVLGGTAIEAYGLKG